MTEEAQTKYAFALVKISDIAQQARCIAVQDVLTDTDERNLFSKIERLYSEVDKLRELDKKVGR